MRIEDSFLLRDFKGDNRAYLEGSGWGPGWYTCTCIKCKQGYLGEKRSNECADCAYGETEKETMCKETDEKRPSNDGIGGGCSNRWPDGDAKIGSGSGN